MYQFSAIWYHALRHYTFLNCIVYTHKLILLFFVGKLPTPTLPLHDWCKSKLPSWISYSKGGFTKTQTKYRVGN